MQEIMKIEAVWKREGSHEYSSDPFSWVAFYAGKGRLTQEWRLRREGGDRGKEKGGRRKEPRQRRKTQLASSASLSLNLSLSLTTSFDIPAFLQIKFCFRLLRSNIILDSDVTNASLAPCFLSSATPISISMSCSAVKLQS